MKVNFLFVCCFTVFFSIAAFAGSTVNVPKKVTTVFHNSFSEVKNEAWFEFKDCYQVFFTNPDSSSCRIYYSKKGKFLYSLKYFSGKGLPVHIRTSVGKKYPDKNIFSVTEVYSNNTTVYYITMEDNQHLYNLESDGNGDITLLNTFKKA